MYEYASDDEVDAIVLTPVFQEPLSTVQVEAKENLAPIKDVLESISWSHTFLCAKQARKYHGLGNDLGGFQFDDDLEPDEEPFEGVRFSNDLSNEEVVISRRAFDRLMTRYFDTLIAMVEERRLAVRDQSWWPEFLAHAAAVRARAESGRAAPK